MRKIIYSTIFVVSLSSVSAQGAEKKNDSCSYCVEQKSIKESLEKLNQSKIREIQKGFSILEKMQKQKDPEKNIGGMVEWIGFLIEEGDEHYISVETVFEFYQKHLEQFKNEIKKQPAFIRKKIERAFSVVGKVKRQGNG